MAQPGFTGLPDVIGESGPSGFVSELDSREEPSPGRELSQSDYAC